MAVTGRRRYGCDDVWRRLLLCVVCALGPGAVAAQEVKPPPDPDLVNAAQVQAATRQKLAVLGDAAAGVLPFPTAQRHRSRDRPVVRSLPVGWMLSCSTRRPAYRSGALTTRTTSTRLCSWMTGDHPSVLPQSIRGHHREGRCLLRRQYRAGLALLDAARGDQRPLTETLHSRRGAS